MTGNPSTMIPSHSEQETREIGRRLGEVLVGGIVVGLSGDLGSGKTRLVQGIAHGLGVSPTDVSSPTFVLCHEYSGRLELLHVDAYRLNSLAEFDDLGIPDALENGRVVIIEWSDRVAAALPADRIEIQIDEISSDRRQLTLKALGAESRGLLGRLSWPPHSSQVDR